MPIYDYECKVCGHLEVDVYSGHEDQRLDCVSCPEKMERIISMSGVHTANEDAAWIRSVTEVVEKDGSCRASMEFLKSPTRTNLKRWMDAKGIRHVENEHGGPPSAFDRSKQQGPDMDKINKEVMELRMKRNTLHVR